MALLDEGETDWKVIVVDVQDPLASKLNDIEDVERHLPGLIRATNEWFRLVFAILLMQYHSNMISQHLQDSGWKAREHLRVLWRGQEQEVCNGDHPRVPRGLEASCAWGDPGEDGKLRQQHPERDYPEFAGLHHPAGLGVHDHPICVAQASCTDRSFWSVFAGSY
jgi:hypothetical protein